MCGVVYTRRMATQNEKLEELQNELSIVKAALMKPLSGGVSVSADGISITRGTIKDLTERRNQLERSIQRIKNGGRGMSVDMSGGPY